MVTVFLLIAVTTLYAGYNLLVKVSSSYVPPEATTTILATICLQLAALAASGLFAAIVIWGGGHVVQLTGRAYFWAILAGLCIGGAEIAYFYLFSGLGQVEALPASTVVPIVVSGTIVITMIVSYAIFREQLTWPQLAGGLLVILGINLLFFGRGAVAA